MRPPENADPALAPWFEAQRIASIDTSVSSGGGVAVGASHSETDFAAQFILGADYPVSNQFSIGARYRFVWVNSRAGVGSGLRCVRTVDKNHLHSAAPYRICGS